MVAGRSCVEPGDAAYGYLYADSLFIIFIYRSPIVWHPRIQINIYSQLAKGGTSHQIYTILFWLAWFRFDYNLLNINWMVAVLEYANRNTETPSDEQTILDDNFRFLSVKFAIQSHAYGYSELADMHGVSIL